jgi:hypothetical protein
MASVTFGTAQKVTSMTSITSPPMPDPPSTTKVELAIGDFSVMYTPAGLETGYAATHTHDDGSVHDASFRYVSTAHEVVCLDCGAKQLRTNYSVGFSLRAI